MADLTKLRIAYLNHVSDPDTVVTSSTTVTKFPAANIRSAYRQVRCRLSTTSGWVRFQLGSPKNVQSFFVTGHNLTPTATLTLRGSTDNFVSSDELIGVYSPTGDPLAEYIDSTIYSEYQIDIEDPANAAGYLEIGRIFLGPFIEMKRNFNHGWTLGRVDLSEKVASTNGVDSFYRKAQRRVVSLPFEHMEQPQRDELEALTEAVGIHTPFFASLNYDENPVSQTIYCRLNSMPDFSDMATRLYDTTLTLIEAI